MAVIRSPPFSMHSRGKFGPDLYTDFICDFLKQNKDEPMMIYFPMALTHGPLVQTPRRPDAKTSIDKHRAMVEYADLMLGRIMNTLNELKIRDNTIVFWTTDNGSGSKITGEYKGEICKGGKATDTERGTNAPFVVSCPGLVPQGVVTDALTDFTGMLPTFAERGGATIPMDKVTGGVIDGKSIAPLITGKAKDSSRSWIMAQGHGPATWDRKLKTGGEKTKRKKGKKAAKTK